MILSIDTSNSDKVKIMFDSEEFITDSRREKSQLLLGFIDQKLKDKKKKLSEIKEIKVVTGPGSFTGLRVGVSVANTLGWALKVPVNGKNVGEDGSIIPSYE